MKIVTCLSVALVANLTGCAAWGGGEFQRVGKIDSNLPTAGTREIIVRNTVGSVRIDASDEEVLRLSVNVGYRGGFAELGRTAIREDFTLERVQDVITLQSAYTGQRGADDWKMDIRMTAPRRLNVHVRGGKGDCRIIGIEGDQQVQVDVGNVEVSSDRLSSVSAETGIGDARLEVHKEGPAADSSCKAGTGNVVIRLPGVFSGEVSLSAGVGKTLVHETPGVTVKETVTSSSAWGKVGIADVKVVGTSDVGNVDFAIR